MKTVTAILLGAGQRGADVYAAYALRHPDEIRFVAVAEPREERRLAFARAHGIAAENAVADWRLLMEKPRMADCAFICTQDDMHFEPLLAAMEKGYDIMVEKPITPDRAQLLALREKARGYGRVISVAHVLRYSPFFTKIKELMDAGAIGTLVNIQHIECVAFWHMAHSFVRGAWRNKAESSPMILAKCCHDIDILLYLVGKPCLRLSSFGSLLHFKKENAPEGAPDFCMDGCAHRDSCPFYAPRFYLEHPRASVDGFRHVVCEDSENDEAVLAALRKGPYGRCVYHCDNDVVDHQLLNMEFADGVTANLTMSAFTERFERVIRVQGTRGEISGWMGNNKIVLDDFTSGHKTEIALYAPPRGHNGSDDAMMRSFTRLVASGGKEKSKTGALDAIASHLIALDAEESRLDGGRAIEEKVAL